MHELLTMIGAGVLFIALPVWALMFIWGMHDDIQSLRKDVDRLDRESGR
ncbi:hypothetical protein [Komagataeibacter europaeus]|nr:hypothetical protein [Komagataeibacter europaeus]ARW16425.1 hypothetical protein S101446_01294 [Komagataeibacter europaeus]